MSAISPATPPQPDLYKIAEKIYNLGDLLLYDDRGDIGRGAYFGRTEHVYQGKVSPDHPSVWHHWPAGILLMASGQLLGVVATMLEMWNAAKSEDFNNIQQVDSSIHGHW